MKRLILLYFSLVMSLLLAFSACSGGRQPNAAEVMNVNDDTHTAAPSPTQQAASPQPTDRPAEDKEYVFDFSNSTWCQLSYYLFETDSAVYYQYCENSRDSIIYFSDKDYKEWMPLCGKPECMHNGGECNAFTEQYASFRMWIYKSYIYYAFRSEKGEYSIELWRMKLDGSDHEKVLVYDMEFEEQPSAIAYYWDFHNRFFIFTYMYSSGNANSLAEEAVNRSLAFDLDAPEKPPVELLNNEVTGGSRRYILLAGQGDYIYYTLNRAPNVLIQQNLSTGEAVKTADLPETPGLCTVLNGDKLLFALDGSESEEPDAPGRVYEADIVTGECRLIYEAAEPVYWMNMNKDYIFGTNNPADGEGRGLYIYRTNGELLYFLPFEQEGVTLLTYYSSNDYVFFNAKMKNGSIESGNPKYYMEIADIINGEPHWKIWGE